MNRFAFVVLAALSAGGCASLVLEREAAAIFELVGRVAVRHGAESASGRIQWRHGPAVDELLFSSPIGQGVARITRRDGEVMLVTADQKEHRAQDAETLTEAVLGWRLPLAGLPDWIQGRAHPARPAELVRDRQERVRELRQDDWRIEYEEYDQGRPSKMRITREGLEIRLAVERWLLPK